MEIIMEMSLNEDELARRAAQDAGAFSLLYDRYFLSVYNYVRYRCQDGDTTNDLVSRIFERVLTRIGQYHPRRGSFRSWLFTLARNEINSHWRRIKRKREVPLEPEHENYGDGPHPESLAIRREVLHDLLEGVARLAERERDLVGLKFAVGMTNREIARMTGLSESNVGVILYRAVRQLREWMEEKEVKNERA